MSPFLIAPAEAASMLGIGKSLFYQMASSGELGPMPIQLSSKRLYRVEELQEWVRQGCPPRCKWCEEKGTISKDKNK